MGAIMVGTSSSGIAAIAEIQTGQQSGDRDWHCGNKDYSLSYSSRGHQQVIGWDGWIWPLSDKQCLASLFGRLEKNKNTFVLIGNSTGGYTRVYRKFFSRLRAACPKGNCTITTYVQHSCASACVEFFMKGDQRLVSPEARFGFHREWIGIYKFVMIAIESRRSFAELYEGLGADRDWMRDHEDELLSNQSRGYWIKAADIIQGKFADRIESNPWPAAEQGPYLDATRLSVFNQEDVADPRVQTENDSSPRSRSWCSAKAGCHDPFTGRNATPSALGVR